LGTGNIANFNKRYRSFDEAKIFTKSLGLKSAKEWSRYCKGLTRLPSLPKDIPACPAQVYKDLGWAGMGDWLGTGLVSPRLRVYRGFEAAAAFASSLGLKNQQEWRLYCKGKIPGLPGMPKDIPSNPANVYKGDGWSGYGNWLGTGTVAPRLIQYRDFSSARLFARSLRLSGIKQWKLFCEGMMKEKGELPPDVPKAPEQVYSNDGWAGLGDWLGTGNVATFNRTYKSFEEARTFVRKLKLKNVDEWHLYCKGKLPDKGKLPSDIPVSPGHKYAKSGWRGFSDWLGNGVTPKKNYRSR
jgi:hypothetical protein